MVVEIQMYELLKTQLGEKDAKTFVQLFQEKMDHTFEQKQNDMATKKDVALLKDEVHTFRSELKDEMRMLRSELKDDMTTLRSEFKDEMNTLRSEFKDEMNTLRSEFKDEMTMLRSEFKDDMTTLRSEFKDDMITLRSDVMRTIFLTTLGQLIAIIASVVTLIMISKK